ncbi:MAG: Ribonuclease HII [candidate division BRC1 bacterium ADurb.BinA364]|nr:MAG: Ribonuclease HII [candidate division BRC1 bacterium ADurb.BinA364]
MAKSGAAARARALWEFDAELRRQAGGPIAGVDEAGRGCLAGPVVAAAVILPDGAVLEGVDDSKRMTPRGREQARKAIDAVALDIGIGIAGPSLIDDLNILKATLCAANWCVEDLNPKPRLLITDYLRMDGQDAAVRAEAKADSKSLSVAAASIVAKTERDRLMALYAMEYPFYAFERNKGYGSSEHLEGLRRHGPSTLHRLSFAGVGFFSDALIRSRTFERLRAMRAQAGNTEWKQAARQALSNMDCPLADRETTIVLEWLERRI